MFSGQGVHVVLLVAPRIKPKVFKGHGIHVLTDVAPRAVL